jgi:hypothetical protein
MQNPLSSSIFRCLKFLHLSSHFPPSGKGKLQPNTKHENILINFRNRAHIFFTTLFTKGTHAFHCVRREVLTQVSMKNTLSWDVVWCSMAYRHEPQPSRTLKMEALLMIHQIIGRYVPEKSNVQIFITLLLKDKLAIFLNLLQHKFHY